MSGFSKLFSTIIASSIWSEDDGTVRVWITLLALKDARGIVDGSIPGLARLANVNREACERALTKFLSPDPDSRDLKLHPEREGRRIEEVPGGWRILNHEFYRDMQVDRDYSMSPDAVRKRNQRRQGGGQNGTSADDVRSVYESESVSVDESVTKEETDKKDSLQGKSAAERSATEQVDAMVKRPGVVKLAAFMAANDFGRFRDLVEGFVRASRSSMAVMATLEMHLTGEMSHEKATALQLGLALQQYAAVGEEQFKPIYFAAFVRKAKAMPERAARRADNANEDRRIAEERREAEARQQEERDRDMLAAFARDYPDRHEELFDAADREIKKLGKMPESMRDVLVHDKLIEMVRQEQKGQ